MTLAEPTQKRDFYHILVSIPYLIAQRKKEDFPEWIDWLELTCLQSGRDVNNDAVRKAGGHIRTYLMPIPMTLLWSSVRQEFKWHFSNLPTVSHAAVNLNSII